MPAEIHDPDLLIRTLAEFRYELRRFYQFSEEAAVRAGLLPRQYQLLLQVAAAPADTPATIAFIAERLGLKHNSAVELVDRSANEGYVARADDPDDRRRTILRVTRKGNNLLGRLAGQHARELNEAAPRLIKALQRIRQHAATEAK